MVKRNRNIFSIPVSQKYQISMLRRFILFSAIIFLFIFILGSAVFVILMEQMSHKNTEYGLSKTIELERFKLEAYVNSEIAIVLKMASSPIILQYFSDSNNDEVKRIAFEDIEGYRNILLSHSLFWVKDTDKEFWLDSEFSYIFDPEDPENYWYNMTMYDTEKYNFNINYNSILNITNLWINAPVFDNNHKPVGILGTGLNLSDFINNIYQSYTGSAELFLFNAAGEITGGKNIDLVKNKVNITEELGQTGDKMFIESKNLKSGEIKYFKTEDGKGIAAIGAIPALNWNIAVIQRFAFTEFLKTGMFALFVAMSAVILFVIVLFNIFIFRMLKPLIRIIKLITHNLSGLELNPQTKNEIETLGELLNLTIIDPLTGVYNRRYFEGNFKRIIKLFSRSGGALSLLVIDIDFFKNYNDTYGHDAGDGCIRSVATILDNCVVREEDFVARYGGEEFVVVLPNTDIAGLNSVAEKLLKKVRESKIPNEASEISDYITISIGGTSGVCNHMHVPSDYIKCADKALYESKKNGRNKYTFVGLS
ncbi:MAG: sensor domain-containing diguanylate cyclase [Deferribacteraceae bacterium]|jgi:diguanylate cyclase (GGDEF)-like protein|nr:sensor domain-containing diguanylate cyclase [Deferribacteraceae bacterium]